MIFSLFNYLVRKCFAFLLACVLGLAIANNASSDFSVRPESDAYHYILLIDSSGSTMRTLDRCRAYESLITDVLILRLFSEGFGSAIPPIRPERDRLSAFHFGLVPCGPGEPFRRIKDYDPIKDLLHPIPGFLRKLKPSQKDLLEPILTSQCYEYTFLSLSMLMAVEAASLGDASISNARTFLILVHDLPEGRANAQKDLSSLETWGTPKTIEPALKHAGLLRNDYSFTDGAGMSDPAWAYDDGRFGMFIQAYEVLSTSWLRQEEQMRTIAPFSQVDVRWHGGFLRKKGLEATVTFNEALLETVKSDVKESPILSLQSRMTGRAIGPSRPFHSFEAQKLKLTPKETQNFREDGFTDLVVAARLPLIQTDSRLGTRHVLCLATSPLRVPSGILRTVLMAILKLTLLATIVGGTYFAILLLLMKRHRTGIKVKLAGLALPVPLPRKGSKEIAPPTSIHKGDAAVTILLPPIILQKLTCKETIISIETDLCNSLDWSSMQGLQHINLPYRQRKLVIRWRETPQEGARLTVNFGQSDDNGRICLSFSAPLPVHALTIDASPSIPIFDHYVSLDLGSDTMAAYHEPRAGVGGRMIPLQHSGRILLEAQPDLLLERDGRTSPRLRTQVELMDHRQAFRPSTRKDGGFFGELTDAHALLDFLNHQGVRSPEYDQSLFQYFHQARMLVGAKIMPNPKIPFQSGGADIIPEVLCLSSEQEGTWLPVRLAPKSILCHLTSQVVNNLILNSSTLRNIPKEKIHLTLTVPNVYSITHAEILTNFLHERLGLGAVEYLYESDAVAYFVLDTPMGQDPENQNLRKFRESMERDMGKEEIRILTIDVGRGTTDLSLISITPPSHNNDRAEHYVLARTGKTDGGNRLSYLFAEHYDRVLRHAFRRVQDKDHPVPPFGFLDLSSFYADEQRMALQAVEKLIETVKASITETYGVRVGKARQIQLIDAVTDALFVAMDPTCKGKEGEYKPFLRDTLRRTLFLDEFLLRGWRRWFYASKLRWLVRKLTPSRLPEDLDLIDIQVRLRGELASYVRSNSTVLLRQLLDMAVLREKHLGSPGSHDVSIRRKLLPPRSTWCVIAGQGSCFMPLQKRLRTELRRFPIPRRHVHSFQNVMAKEACSRGAVTFQRSGSLRRNVHELHGTYGFLRRVNLPEAGAVAFKPLDMSLRRGGTETVTFSTRTEYLFIYSSRAGLDPRHPPSLQDGCTAVIDSFHDKSFEVTYDPNHSDGPLIVVNGKAITSLPTFGSFHESIYPKVWPEHLRGEGS